MTPDLVAAFGLYLILVFITGTVLRIGREVGVLTTDQTSPAESPLPALRIGNIQGAPGEASSG